MKLVVLFILIVCLLPTNLMTNSSVKINQTIESSNTQSTIESVSQNYSELLNIYIHALINQGENISPNSMRWKKYLNLAGNDSTVSQYYYGLYYGAAGIGEVFLNLYNSTTNNTYLGISEKLGNYLISHVLTSKSGLMTAFPKSEDDLYLYTGEKYGQAGIVTFLLDLYSYSGNSTYLSYAESTLQFLYEYRTVTNYGFAYYYSIIPNAAPLTGIIYGSTGIAKSFLTAYEVTHNETYLDSCTKIMSWVLNMTDFTSNDPNGLRRVLYSDDPTYDVYFTGYQSGAAGIGDFLLTLYKVTDNSNYLLYAKQLGNWLLYEENGTGYWSSYNAVDYLTNQYTNNEEGSFLGYSGGVSGMAIFLMDLFTATNDSYYLGAVVRAKNFLINNELTNGTQIYWKTQIKGNYENRTETDLSLGVAGIGLFFIKYYELFGTSDALSVLNGINNFYQAITTSEGLVPYLIGVSPVIYDSSYFDGLAGIITYYLEVNNTISLAPKYNSSILDSIPGFNIPVNPIWYDQENSTQVNSTSSSSSINSSSKTNTTKNVNFNALLFALIPVLLALSIKRKKYK